MNYISMNTPLPNIAYTSLACSQDGSLLSINNHYRSYSCEKCQGVIMLYNNKDFEEKSCKHIKKKQKTDNIDDERDVCISSLSNEREVSKEHIVISASSEYDCDDNNYNNDNNIIVPQVMPDIVTPTFDRKKWSKSVFGLYKQTLLSNTLEAVLERGQQVKRELAWYAQKVNKSV